MNIIGNKRIFLSISGAFVGAAIIAIIAFGFRQGIDFSGGTLLSFKTGENTPSVVEIQTILNDELQLKDTRVNFDSTNKTFLARLPHATEEDHQKTVDTLADKIPQFEELQFQTIGPSVGAELRQRSITAIILVLIGISLYIAFAFRKVYRPISSWKYGWITLVSLFHDVLIPAGMLAVLGHYHGVEIDGNFIVALLVIMGFSVHDTIVVFDRIRENLLADKGRTDFGVIINNSVNQTLARSINTSLTLIVVLISLYFVGPQALQYFVLTLLVGVTIGIYSSIFVASPLLHVWHTMTSKEPTRRTAP